MKRCIIFCAGEFKDLVELVCDGDVVITADGGFRHLEPTGLVPVRRTVRGCRIPWLRMLSAKSCSASSRKMVRGWAGLGRMALAGKKTTRPVSM